MKHYAKIENEKVKIVSVGFGTDSAFYESIGMTPMDVEQGYNGQWYVAGYAPKQPIDELRTAALSRIDSATSSAILTGFEYEIEMSEGKEVLHFSYLIEDQQNFSDTFNGIAMKKLMGFENLPETIDWNGWRNHTANFKGELVVLTLTPDDFLNLYTQGALVHKQTHLETGKQRKKAIENASSVDEINNLLKEWNI
jgi:hypothetical protein